MKKYLIFAISLFSFCFINVKAENLKYWGCENGIRTPIRGYLHSLNSGTSYDDNTISTDGVCISSPSTSDVTSTSYKSIYQAGGTNYTIGSNGFFLSALTNTSFYKDYLYSVSLYVCNNSSLPSGNNFDFYISNTEVFSNSTKVSHYYWTYKTLNKTPFDGMSFNTCYQYFGVVRANNNGSFLGLHLFGSNSSANELTLIGYDLEVLGDSTALKKSDIENIISDSGLATATSVNEVKSAVNQVKEEMSNLNDTQKETNNKLDDINNADISDQDKELPNTDSFDNYKEGEQELMNKVNQANLDGLTIGIDANSSSFVWITLTNIIQTHPLIFSMVIAILSIGIIKLALGR